MRRRSAKAVLKATSGVIIKADPFGFEILVWPGVDNFIDGTNEIFDLKQEKERDGADGLATYYENDITGKRKFAIMIPAEWDEDTVWHECLHMCWFILDYAGVIINGDNHEIQCYLQQSLVQQIRDAWGRVK